METLRVCIFREHWSRKNGHTRCCGQHESGAQACLLAFQGWFFKKVQKKCLLDPYKTIAKKSGVLYNGLVVCPRDEVVSCRQARRVIIMDQPVNRAADLRRVRLCTIAAHPAACT
jgi:hypothetical protein